MDFQCGLRRLGKVAQSCNQYASAVCTSEELQLDVSVVWNWDKNIPKIQICLETAM